MKKSILEEFKNIEKNGLEHAWYMATFEIKLKTMNGKLEHYFTNAIMLDKKNNSIKFIDILFQTQKNYKIDELIYFNANTSAEFTF